MAVDFRPALFGHLDVTLPNASGICHILDGQHRWQAAMKKFGGDPILPCRIHSITAHPEAAELFADLNTLRKGVDELSLFFARRAAGHDDEVRVNTIVRAAGLEIGKTRQGSIACPGALLSVYRNYGPGTLTAALDVLQCVYGNDKSAFMSPLIRGVAHFLHTYRDADYNRLIRKLIEGNLSDPHVLIRKGQEARRVNNYKNTPIGISFAMLRAYNFSSKRPLKGE
jgi:hypothetical protein